MGYWLLRVESNLYKSRTLYQQHKTKPCPRFGRLLYLFNDFGRITHYNCILIKLIPINKTVCTDNTIRRDSCPFKNCVNYHFSVTLLFIPKTYRFFSSSISFRFFIITFNDLQMYSKFPVLTIE